jgi:hypothetical protein
MDYDAMMRRMDQQLAEPEGISEQQETDQRETAHEFKEFYRSREGQFDNIDAAYEAFVQYQRLPPEDRSDLDYDAMMRRMDQQQETEQTPPLVLTDEYKQKIIDIKNILIRDGFGEYAGDATYRHESGDSQRIVAIRRRGENNFIFNITRGGEGAPDPDDEVVVAYLDELEGRVETEPTFEDYLISIRAQVDRVDTIIVDGLYETTIYRSRPHNEYPPVNTIKFNGLTSIRRGDLISADIYKTELAVDEQNLSRWVDRDWRAEEIASTIKIIDYEDRVHATYNSNYKPSY